MKQHYPFSYPRKFVRALIIFCVLISGTHLCAQLVVTPGVSTATLLSSLVGQGMTVSNVQLNCPTNAYGTFANGNTTNMGITNGILLTTGSATNAIGPNNSGSSGTCNGTSSSDPQLTAIEPFANEDVCILEFDVVPQCNTMQIRFVFGSEEYPEFVNSSFNDAFGFFISGPGPACQANYYNNTNVATLPNNVTPVSIDNVNAGANSAYYINNASGTTIQYDGFTTVLTRTISLCPCQTYHWKLAIADAGDCYYDSGVFVDFISCSNALSLTETHVNTGCSGCTGSANVTVTGGIGPFTYNWAPAPGAGQGTLTPSSMCPGTYTLTVTDALSCSPASTIAVTITSSGTLTLSGSQTNITCNGSCTGSATTTIVTGTGPFTYAWTPSGGTAASATGLCAGTYTCTVTASGGCTAQQTFNITQPPAITLTPTQTNVTCNGVCNGTASVVATGGNGTYTYAWAPSGGTATSATSLCAGTYTCTVSSPAGCTRTQTFNITQPPAITLTPTQTNVTCAGSCNGTASVTATGGTGTYTYAWAPSGGTGASATALCAGSYTCTVSSPAGCTRTQTFTITQPPAITLTPTQTNIVCNGSCTGTASVTATGGTGSYTYAWAPSGGTGASATALCAGTYTCTVSSPAGCTATQSFNITQPPAITLTPTQTNVLCNGACTGTASVAATGGNGTYTYAWAPSGGTAASATALCAGTYTCTVSSPAGCTRTQTFTITQPPAITLTPAQTNITCNGGTGSATVTATGGTGTYTYAWAPSGGTGASATGLAAGTYTCTVTSGPVGCTATQTFNITQPPAITLTPTQTNVACNGQCTGVASVVATGGTGTYTYAWAPSGGTGASATALCAGTYTVTVSSPAGCTRTQSFTITQPPALTITPTQTNVTCNGACTGTASVVATGGPGTYTYAWAPSGGTGASATALCAGVYTCTITSNPGSCTATQTFNITQAPVITATQTQTNVLCNGACTGQAAVVASGGTGTYTYAWTPSGGTAATATGLCAGTYTCTITSGPVGCTITKTFSITQPPALAASSSSTPATCGSPNGSAAVSASGGSPGYTYAWAPSGGTGPTATGLLAGSYTCTITDANGCTLTRTVTVTNSGGPTANITASTNANCFGSSTGSATVAMVGGTGPFTYVWAPAPGGGQGTATATGLPAGTFVVTVTDANGCVATATAIITQPPAITLTPAQTNVTCNGAATGSATVTATGGTGTYTYAWAPSGGTAASATGLAAGTYTCTVTSGPVGCTATQTFSITQPPVITATQSQTNILCNGVCNGQAAVVASGGNGTYTYAWTPSGGTAATATGLCAGTYTCTITSGPVGCTITKTFNITQPAALASSTSFTQATCGMSNGSASVTVTGGTGPYTYAWSPLGGTGSSVTGRPAGTYTVVFTDANGCTGTASVTIPNAGSPTATITATVNVSCFGGNNGSATVAASGGTGPYTYAWIPTGGTGTVGTPLTANNYTVTVTDVNGCSTTATVAITQPPAFTSTAVATPVLCNGGATGTASVSTTGGAGGNTYNWTPGNPTGDGTANVTGLTAGTWSITVTDVNGCTTQSTVAVTQPTAITTTMAATPVLCNGGSTGTAAVTAAGGTGAYTYLWAPSGGTGSSATGLAIGTYSVTVTDANGCTRTSTVAVTQPTAVTATTSFTQATCGSSNGSASVSASGGTGPYTYAWSPLGGTTATVGGRPAGPYTCLITDANGCTFTASVTIPNAGSPTVTITSTVNVSCFGGNNGSAVSSASGGTGPYSYAWTPSGGTGATGTALIAGAYTVTVTDVNGCSATATVTITQPAALTVTATSSAVLCFGGATGSATCTATGGAGGYTYAWTPSGGSAATATGLAATTYTCTVTDANGCTAQATTTVTQPTALTATTSSSPVLCFGGSTGSASVTASGGTGAYTYAWSPSGGNAAGATALAAGPYTCLITDANGCTFTASVTVTQPTALAATTSFTQSTCGSSNGAASVSVSGGTGAYTYAWSPSGGNAASASSLAAGPYTCLITDANGCTFTASVTVPNAGSPTATIIATTNVSCFGGNNGSATVSASGGTGPYTYAWAPIGGTGITGTALTAQSYTVTVTDFNGCTVQASVVITEPPVLTATAAASPVLCFGGATGSATCTPTGGVGPYSYSWTPTGGIGAIAPGLTAQAYTCTVTDQNGCTTTASTTVTQPPVLAVTATSSPVLCFGGSTGSTTCTPTGGTGAYTFNWTPTGGTGQGATGLSQGIYTITVTDANACTASATVTVTEPPALTATTSFTQSTCSQANGSAAVVAAGGSPTYTYSWSPTGGSGATAANLIAQPYSCLITDLNGCSLTASVTVPNAGSPTVTIVATDSVSCFGGSDGFAACATTGGTTPYTYLWSNADADTLAGGLIAGSYSVTVTDANGCSSTASVTIGEPPLLTATATSTDVLCFGGNTGTASSTVIGGTGSYTYNWTPSGGTGANATALIAAVYTITVTDINGCTAQATTTVSEPPLITLTATFTPVLCNGGSTGSATATAAGGFGTYTYTWTPTGGNAATASNLTAGPYTIDITDQNGCTASATTTVTEPTAIVTTSSAVDANCNQSDGSVSANANGGTGTLNYQWQNGGPVTSNWNNIPSGSYTVIVTDQNGCTDTLIQAVQNLNGVNAVLNSSTNLTCFSAGNGAINVDATGGVGPYVYTWTPNVSATDSASSLAAGQYTVVVSDVSGCSSTVTVLLTEPSLLTVQASANPTAICVGTQITLNSNAGGGTPAYTYSWTPSAPPLVGQTQNVTPLVTTTYTVTVTDANGCTGTSPVLVTVNPQPTPLFAADVTAGCVPVCVTFSDLTTVASGSITGWSWDFGDNTTSTQQNPPVHCYNTPGVYTVILTVTTNAGCTQTLTMTNYISVFAMPVALFGASPQPTTILNPTITFTDSSTNAASWMWNFGDLLASSSTDQNPTFTYPEPDCYLVELEVTSPDGCVDTDTHTVCIAPDVSIYVPNTFTPDGNGLNDEFIPVTIGIDPDKYELWIFDRWGNMIYYSDELDEGWDGKVIGGSEICQVDTYVWKIKAQDVLGNKHNLIGHVNLIK